MRNLFLVAYDVSDDRRLRMLFKKMHAYGDPVQYSIFQCALSPSERVVMTTAVREIINEKEDRVLIVNLGPVEGEGGDRMQHIGRTSPLPVRAPVVV